MKYRTDGVLVEWPGIKDGLCPTISVTVSRQFIACPVRQLPVGVTLRYIEPLVVGGHNGSVHGPKLEEVATRYIISWWKYCATVMPLMISERVTMYTSPTQVDASTNASTYYSLLSPHRNLIVNITKFFPAKPLDSYATKHSAGDA